MKADGSGKRWYGYHFNRQPEDAARCVEEVFGRERGDHPHQCRSKRGHGPDGLYCKVHDPAAKEKRSAEAEARWQAKLDKQMAPHRLKDAYRTALEDIAAGHNDPRARAREALETK